jgi:hypothetical protein
MATIRRKNGKWQALVRHRGHSTQSRTFLLRTDAVRWSKLAEAEADKHGLGPDRSILRKLTLGDLLRRFLDVHFRFLGVGSAACSWTLRKFGFLRWGEVERSGMGELLLRLVRLARICQRLAPFQVQPSPVGGVLVRFRELRQRQV